VEKVKFKLLNGVELTEGDIVEQKVKPRSKPIRGRVFWCEKRLQFRIMWLFRGAYAGLHDSEVDHSDYDIIGSYYDNPKLWDGFEYNKKIV
jgi:hypothetical protein